jgi:protein-S-isoprenylcysteine O-methyltransferase Ste14
VLVSTFLISHLDLFGLRQVWLHYRAQEYSPVGFRRVFLYNFVRHPIMLGFIIAFWATPHMSVGHLLFAAATTAYILIALHFEERDLVAHLGVVYEEYRAQVSMIMPMLPRGRR